MLDEDKQEIAKILQLVLYLCSEQPDIQSGNGYKYCSSFSVPLGNNTVTVKEWNTGERIGAALRKESQEAFTSHNIAQRDNKDRKSVRPHLRKGHFHYY